jgi:hypothetical protein
MDGKQVTKGTGHTHLLKLTLCIRDLQTNKTNRIYTTNRKETDGEVKSVPLLLIAWYL